MKDMPDPHKNNMASQANGNAEPIQNPMTPMDRRVPIPVHAIREPRRPFDHIAKNMPVTNPLKRHREKEEHVK